MQRFIVLRFFQALVALFAVSIIVFSLARISGDPLDTLLSFESGPEQRAAVAKYWGLDRPLPEQYLKFIGNAFQGDFGTSFKWRLPTFKPYPKFHDYPVIFPFFCVKYIKLFRAI